MVLACASTLFSTNSAIAFSGFPCESAMIRIAFQSSPILSLPRSATWPGRRPFGFGRRAELSHGSRDKSFSLTGSLRIKPRIEHGEMCFEVIASVARNDREAMMPAGRRDNQVGLGKGMACFAAFLHQQSPLKHDVFGNRQHTLLEHRTHFVGKPVVKRGAACNLGQQFDAEANLGQRHCTDVEQFERLRLDDRKHLRLWPRAPNFRQDVGIEQPSRHGVTSRTGTGSGLRLASMSMSRCGDACTASISAFPVMLPLRRRKSSAAMTTTSSRPCTVTCCGPSLRTLRTSSLNLAFAS